MKDERRRISQRVAYFACQGVATLIWWALVGGSPAVRRWFAFGDDGTSLMPFLPADLVMWAGGSLVAAWGDWIGAAWTAPLRHVVFGAMACSVLHALALAMLSRGGWPGVLLMTPALVCTAWFTWHDFPSKH